MRIYVYQSEADAIWKEGIQEKKTGGCRVSFAPSSLSQMDFRLHFLEGYLDSCEHISWVDGGCSHPGQLGIYDREYTISSVSPSNKVSDAHSTCTGLIGMGDSFSFYSHQRDPMVHEALSMDTYLRFLERDIRISIGKLLQDCESPDFFLFAGDEKNRELFFSFIASIIYEETQKNILPFIVSGKISECLLCNNEKILFMILESGVGSCTPSSVPIQSAEEIRVQLIAVGYYHGEETGLFNCT